VEADPSGMFRKLMNFFIIRKAVTYTFSKQRLI
jgi:hypothetical protein